MYVLAIDIGKQERFDQHVLRAKDVKAKRGRDGIDQTTL